jgi:hypothetical protein
MLQDLDSGQVWVLRESSVSTYRDKDTMIFRVKDETCGRDVAEVFLRW